MTLIEFINDVMTKNNIQDDANKIKKLIEDIAQEKANGECCIAISDQDIEQMVINHTSLETTLENMKKEREAKEEAERITEAERKAKEKEEKKAQKEKEKAEKKAKEKAEKLALKEKEKLEKQTSNKREMYEGNQQMLF